MRAKADSEHLKRHASESHAINKSRVFLSHRLEAQSMQLTHSRLDTLLPYVVPGEDGNMWDT
ncbi:hypothetical protein E2C01_062183 [Portunus trituberculatus]|uniref:Uncharacterized protein n=1 Tax=Portunus trituberculatus TaxID=210409 RepID=A0A5B7HHB1_PORTR|nr:hypothetical protein [Portunus trituberculatus]